MTISRSLGISAGIHLVIMLLIAISLAFDKPAETITETIRIRIKMQSESRQVKTVSGGDPSGIPRNFRPEMKAPVASAVRYDALPEEIGRTDPTMTLNQNTHSQIIPVQVSSVDPNIDGIGNIDPLAGLLPEEETSGNPDNQGEEQWNLSWSNGRERGILKFPDFDQDFLTVSYERLSNVAVAIKVSSAGDVVSAEVIPPGSGDVRIDRYLHSLALELLLEPGFVEEDVQEGLLRLVFAEGRQ